MGSGRPGRFQSPAPHGSGRADFPATRKALKGHTELAGTEFLVTTSYQFGAIVPDQDLGRKLVAVVKAEVKGSKPQLVCMRPNIG